MTNREKFDVLMTCFEKSNLENNNIIRKLYIQISNLDEDQFTDNSLFDCITELCNEIDKFPDGELSKIKDLNDEIENLKDEVHDLESTIEDSEDEVDNLEQEIDEMKDVIKDLEGDLSSANDTISELEASLNSEKEENENLRMRLHD